MPLSDMFDLTRLTLGGKLAEATALIQAKLAGHPTPPPAKPFPGRTTDAQTSPTGRFLTEKYTSPAGDLAYKLYIPVQPTSAPMPLLVMLHGCTQSPDDFAAGTGMNALAEQHGFLVAYPAQTQSANAQKCWNWFNPADQARDRGEPALIAGVTRAIMAAHPVDPKRVYVAGLSAGGAAASIMGVTYPELYAAVGVHSGLACGAARDMTTAFTAMRQGHAGRPVTAPPTIVFHGDRDTTVNIHNADAVIAQANHPGNHPGLRIRVESGQSNGHKYTRRIHSTPDGHEISEQWIIHHAPHAWSGGNPAGSFTDPKGPNASQEFVRFFLAHPHE